MSAQPNSTAGNPSAIPVSEVLKLLPPLGPNFGALLVSTFLSLILYGTGIHQAYRYARLYVSDPVSVKSYVAVLLVLDTFHSVLCMHTSYWFLVTNFFNPLALIYPPWSINMSAIVTAIIIAVAQSFYARRVYLLDKKYRPLIAVVGILLLAQLAIGSAFTARAFILMDIRLLSEVSWMQTAGFSLVVANDIALTLVLTLSLHRARTGFKRTDSKIDILIAYAICTGLVTDVVTVASLIIDRASPGTLMFSGADMICVKVYVNSVLATINTRGSSLEGGRSGSEEMKLSSLSKNARNNAVDPWSSSAATGVESASEIKFVHAIGGQT